MSARLPVGKLEAGGAVPRGCLLITQVPLRPLTSNTDTPAKSNAADGQKDPQIHKRICETPH